MQQRDALVLGRELVGPEPRRAAAGQDDAGDAQSRARFRRCTYWKPNRPFTQRWPFVTE